MTDPYDNPDTLEPGEQAPDDPEKLVQLEEEGRITVVTERSESFIVGLGT